MATRKYNAQEYLSKDILEENFLNIFMFIYRLQFLLGTSRVHAKIRFITQPTILQKCYTIMCVMFMLGSFCAVLIIIVEVDLDKSIKSLGVSLMFSILTASALNIIHVRFFNGRLNAEFHIRIQKLDRLIQIDKCKTINTALVRINRISVILILIVLIAVFGVTYQSERFSIITFLAVSYCVFTFFLELIACSGFVYYFFVRVRFVNCLIEKYLKLDDNLRQPVILDSLKSCRFLDQDTINCFITSDSPIYIREIFSCFAMFQKLYRYQLLVFCVKLVVTSLLTFEVVLYIKSKNIFRVADASGQIAFLAIDSFIALFLAFRFEAFFSEVKETKRLCISVMALHQEGKLRQKARTILRMIQETPPKFSVYDIWEMNARLFVTIFCLITSLIVTLIQFAFL